MYNRRKIGSDYEEEAKQFLELRGYQWIESNYSCRWGEIDLIAKDGNYLCFVEVKYRSHDRMGMPEDSVDYYKQQKIIKTARYYLYQRHIVEDTAVRFDAVFILKDEFTLVKDAFNMEA